MEGLPKTFDQRLKDLKGGETLKSAHEERNIAATDYQNKIDEIDNLNIKGDLKDELSQIAHNETIAYSNEKIQEFRDKGLELSDLDALKSRHEMIVLEQSRVVEKMKVIIEKEVYSKNNFIKSIFELQQKIEKGLLVDIAHDRYKSQNLDSLIDMGLVSGENDIVFSSVRIGDTIEGDFNLAELNEALKIDLNVAKNRYENDYMSKEYDELRDRKDKLIKLDDLIMKRILELRDVQK